MMCSEGNRKKMVCCRCKGSSEMSCHYGTICGVTVEAMHLLNAGEFRLLIEIKLAR